MNKAKKLIQYDNCEIIDLSELNIFDAVKKIVLISTNNIKTNPSKKLKCKVSTPDIQNILSDLPVSNMVEIV